MKREGMLAGAFSLLSGCTVGPDWQQPKIEAPPAWRIDYAQAAELANAKWWEAFGDPVLDQLVEDALRENRDLLQAAARVDQFLGALRTTRSQFYPQFGYSGDASRNRASENGPTPLPAGIDRDYSLYERRARRVLADRPLRPRAPPGRGGAGAGLRERAGPPRRGAVGGCERHDRLHHAARARPSARDRARHRDELRRLARTSSSCATRAARCRSSSARRSSRSTGRRRPRCRASSGRSRSRRTCCRCCSAATPATSRAASRSRSCSTR